MILAGGGIVMGNAQDDAVALAELLQAPVCVSYLHNDAFPSRHPLWCGPLGYQGSKAAMKLIAQADVVLALGTRLGPFGTLPQHGLDYWPKTAKITCSSVRTCAIGTVASIACTSRRSELVRLSGSWVLRTARIIDEYGTCASGR